MKIHIEFDIDNAAFEDAWDFEVARLLVKAKNLLQTDSELRTLRLMDTSEAKRLLQDDSKLGTFRLMDSNGNTVGYLAVKE